MPKINLTYKHFYANHKAAKNYAVWRKITIAWYLALCALMLVLSLIAFLSKTQAKEALIVAEKQQIIASYAKSSKIIGALNRRAQEKRDGFLPYLHKLEEISGKDLWLTGFAINLADYTMQLNGILTKQDAIKPYLANLLSSKDLFTGWQLLTNNHVSEAHADNQKDEWVFTIFIK
jgi:hypothetical protein